MKVLSGNKRVEVDGFASYLNREYEKFLNIVNTRVFLK